MELRHLRYFVAVAEALNFSEAARQLHVSQPPLSRQIRDLEHELGVALFDRAKSKVRLTAAGEFLYPEAKRLLAQSEDLMRDLRRFAAAPGPELRIGYVANVHGPAVIEAATRFRKAHPDVVVKVFDSSTREQVAGILSGALDLGFVGFRLAADQGGLEVAAVETTHAVMAMPENHPLANGRHPLSAFKKDPFVTISEEAFPGARQYVLQFCRDAGFRPRIVHEALEPIDILNLVAIGEGVALVPERMQRSQHPGVVFCRLREPVPRVDSYVAWKKGNRSPLIQDMVESARRTYRQLARAGSKGTRDLSGGNGR